MASAQSITEQSIGVVSTAQDSVQGWGDSGFLIDPGGHCGTFVSAVKIGASVTAQAGLLE